MRLHFTRKPCTRLVSLIPLSVLALPARRCTVAAWRHSALLHLGDICATPSGAQQHKNERTYAERRATEYETSAH